VRSGEWVRTPSEVKNNFIEKLPVIVAAKNYRVLEHTSVSGHHRDNDDNPNPTLLLQTVLTINFWRCHKAHVICSVQLTVQILLMQTRMPWHRGGNFGFSLVLGLVDCSFKTKTLASQFWPQTRPQSCNVGLKLGLDLQALALDLIRKFCHWPHHHTFGQSFGPNLGLKAKILSLASANNKGLISMKGPEIQCLSPAWHEGQYYKTEAGIKILSSVCDEAKIWVIRVKLEGRSR